MSDDERERLLSVAKVRLRFFGAVLADWYEGLAVRESSSRLAVGVATIQRARITLGVSSGRHKDARAGSCFCATTGQAEGGHPGE